MIRKKIKDKGSVIIDKTELKTFKKNYRMQNENFSAAKKILINQLFI